MVLITRPIVLHCHTSALLGLTKPSTNSLREAIKVYYSHEHPILALYSLLQPCNYPNALCCYPNALYLDVLDYALL